MIVMSKKKSDLDRHIPGSQDLLEFGKLLTDKDHPVCDSELVIGLAEELLFVRTRSGAVQRLRANTAQLAFEQTRGQRNIVLKARQLGLTTWAAARFFLKTIAKPGTLTLQVAHTLDSAEEMFRIVHRFLDHMPQFLKESRGKTSHANARQIVFPVLDSE